jgi:hypothetical protein
MVWLPGQPWPSGTPGGAQSPHWGGYVKLWVRAAIAAGDAFHMGQHPLDRLDGGNVMGGAAPVGRGAGAIDRLWVDLSCDVTDVGISGGASTAQGIFSKSDAATVTVTIADPTGIYDPLNPAGPFSYGSRSRLVPGVPVEVWCEVVNGDDGTWTHHDLFTGTADSWQQDWTPHPWDRQTILIATDATKTFARFDRPEVAPQGAGDTVGARIHRIVNYFGWTDGSILDPPGGSTVTLLATTLAQSAWELLNRATDDELGYIYFTPSGDLRWLNRSTWTTPVAEHITLGCDVGYDVLLDATPSALDRQIRNAIYAARVGGTTRTAISQSSIDRYGRYDYTRTDLGLADDAQAGSWAAAVLELYAFPQITLGDVTFRPSIVARSFDVYDDALSVALISDIVHIVWSPPDLPASYTVDNLSRVVGYSHTISRHVWEISWQLVAANAMQFAGVEFTMGPHAQDRLDAGNVMAFV